MAKTKKVEVAIREVCNYTITVRVPVDADAENVAKAARRRFLANVKNATLESVDERSFEVLEDGENFGQVYDENELTDEEDEEPDFSERGQSVSEEE